MCLSSLVSRMKSLARSLALICCAIVSACAVQPKEQEDVSIGSAVMRRDHSIVLQLGASSPDGATGDAEFVYPPSHPEYDSVLPHVGPLVPGQSVSVRPWPDTPKADSTRG